jgi:hypothetical protein
MPTLLFFVPCEKAIIDRNGALSIISIMGKLTVGVPSNVPPPAANAMLPVQWAMVSIWQQSSDWEIGRTFEQRAALVSESGNDLLTSIAAFQFSKETPLFQVVAQVSGMPMSIAGNLKFKVWVREKTEPSKEWKEAGSFPFVLEIQPMPPPDAPVN